MIQIAREVSGQAFRLADQELEALGQRLYLLFSREGTLGRNLGSVEPPRLAVSAWTALVHDTFPELW
jgi:hypothetical protein